MNETNFYYRGLGISVRRRKWIKDEHGIFGMDDVMSQSSVDNRSNKIRMYQFSRSYDRNDCNRLTGSKAITLTEKLETWSRQARYRASRSGRP